MRIINGVDIVDISRIEKILEKNRDIFLKKIFTDNEIIYIDKKNYNKETIAGMFAGKEAISKAVGTGIGKLKWQDMEILHYETGKPYVEIDRDILNEFKIKYLEISISHERMYAVAFVVGEKDC